MSSNEYAKVKGSLVRLLNWAAKDVARQMDSNLYLAAMNRDNPILKEFYKLEAETVFDQFTAVVDTLYPNNRRKLEDMVQYVDELVMEFGRNRKPVD